MLRSDTYLVLPDIQPDYGAVGVTGVLSAIWLWLGLLSKAVLWPRGCGCGDCKNHMVSPMERPVMGRASRRLRHHISKGPLAPARNLRPLYALNRNVTPTQFLERRCRLSADGRIRVYRIPYWSPRRAREAFMALFSRGAYQTPGGLWDAHIAPD